MPGAASAAASASAPPEEATGDVVAQDIGTAPGKEREREPLYGGDLANLGPADAPGANGNGNGNGNDAGEGEEKKDGADGEAAGTLSYLGRICVTHAISISPAIQANTDELAKA